MKKDEIIKNDINTNSDSILFYGNWEQFADCQ